MARSRNIKPSIMDNDQLAELDPLTRLLFVYTWMLADREGRLEDRPKRIAAQALPFDRDANADAMLADLAQAGFIVRYKVDGQAFIEIPGFTKHQNPHIREAASTIPARPNLGEDEHQPRKVQEREREDTHLSESLRRRVIDRDGGRCLSCKIDADLHVDHIIPRARGGRTEEGNLQTLCRKCNQSKGARHHTDYRSTNLGTDQHQPSPADSLIPDSLIPDKEAAPSGPAPLPAERKKPAVLLRTWLEQCRLAGEKAISDYEPIKVYVEKSSLPWEFVQLCWDEFRRRHMPGGGSEMKRQSDWRKTFLNCLQGNWYRLWWARAEGEYELTSSGLQAKTVNRVPEAA